jgi:putative FmdB family regulatory protein
MPIYEYQCTKCGQVKETWQKFSDPPVTECDLCHGKMKKLISQSSFHLKGTGWYVTDYASKTGGNQSPQKPTEKKTGEQVAKKKETPQKDSPKKAASDS